ncbi:MAG TPA: BatA domain-containing protein, partial [Cyclobacteriaceae bacterium]|nr:BatA domain-containing protein [Cyclobacteriaceae bacterium]
MAFANPSWLWGLSALLIPITIHLLSRKEGKVIPVGSLRYLKDANTQQFKSLRLNEVILLLLRCLLFSLVILFISGLQMAQNNNLKWVLVEERLKDDSRATSVSDSLINQGYELHYLTSQLAVEGKLPSSTSYWALAE